MEGVRKSLDTIGQNLHNKEFLEKFGIITQQKNGIMFVNYNIYEKPTKYNMLCRGTIYKPDGDLLLFPLPRFFNLHEPQCAVVDWRYAKTMEKLDGTMVCVWFDGTKWRLSTRRMVDTLAIQSFGSSETIDIAIKFKEFFPPVEKFLNGKYWYIFEIICEENRVVTKYPQDRYGLYLLAVRHKTTLRELKPTTIRKMVKMWNLPKVYVPETYDLQNSNAAMKMFHGRPADFEGVVVVDNNFNRIKIKQKSYIRLHHIISGISSTAKIINLVLDGEQSEICSYFPDMLPMFTDVEKKLNMLKSDIMTEFGKYNHLQTQKEFALAVKDSPYSHPLFNLRKGIDLKTQFSCLEGKKLEKFLQK